MKSDSTGYIGLYIYNKSFGLGAKLHYKIICPSLSQSVNHSVCHSPSDSHSLRQIVTHSVRQSLTPSDSHSLRQSVSPSVRPSLTPLDSLSLRLTVTHSVRQSLTPSDSHLSVSHSVSQYGVQSFFAFLCLTYGQVHVCGRKPTRDVRTHYIFKLTEK